MSKKKKTKARKAQEARTRAELILKVRSGQMTATDAARELGVSRKTYYKWEARGLAGMMEALEEKQAGCPVTDPREIEKQQLMKQIETQKEEIKFWEKKYELKELIDDFFKSTDSIASEITSSSQRSSNK